MTLAPKLAPADVAALAAGVKPNTIRQWAARGKLTRHGTSSRRLYDLREVGRIVQTRNQGGDNADSR